MFSENKDVINYANKCEYKAINSRADKRVGWS